MEILYYGRLRDAIGLDREPVDLPSHVLTVDDLIAHLRGLGPAHAEALAPAGLRAALEGKWADAEDSIFGAVEVAILPTPSFFAGDQ